MHRTGFPTLAAHSVPSRGNSNLLLVMPRVFREVCLKLLVPVLSLSGQPLIGNTVLESAACSKLQVSFTIAF